MKNYKIKNKSDKNIARALIETYQSYERNFRRVSPEFIDFTEVEDWVDTFKQVVKYFKKTLDNLE